LLNYQNNYVERSNSSSIRILKFFAILFIIF